MDWAKSVYWMYSILVEEGDPDKRDQLIQNFKENGIETRPFFYPIHIFPWYTRGETFRVSPPLIRDPSLG